MLAGEKVTLRAGGTHEALPDERNEGIFVYINGEFYRREDQGIQRLNELLDMATQIRRNFLAGFVKSFQPIRPQGQAPAGVTVDQQPEPSSKDCQLPGG